MEAEQSKRTRLLFVGLAAVVGLLFVTSGITGFVVNPYTEKINELTTQLADTEQTNVQLQSDNEACGSSLAETEARVAGMGSELDDTKGSLEACTADLGGTRNELDETNEELESAKSSLSETQASLASVQQAGQQLQESYNSLAGASARDLCCIRRVFDNSLTHYYVENNRIICTSDSTKTPFSC